MIRLIAFLVLLALLVAGLAWLADRPGEMVINWLGYEMQPTVFQAVVALGIYTGLVLLAWTLFQQLATTPASLSRFFRRRRERQGLEALSAGMIAIGAGDRALAARYTLQARRSLPNEPLTDLLRAQTALLSGDRGTARRIYEAMLQSPDTELLGLRGLFLEAEREGETVAARQFAERAVKRNPKLAWATDALFGLQCKQGDWDGALQTLALQVRGEHVDKKTADRRRAVLLTAIAKDAEDTDMDRAQAMASEALALAPDLVPAAVIAGRIFASRGKTKQAATVIEKTWKRSPHPELAHVYAYARPGDSTKDRLQRVKELANTTPNNPEAPIAVATAAIDAHEWAEARRALTPLLEDGPSERVCVLMARIEGGERGDTGRVREWLARAITAPRDPAWMADGHVFDEWAAVSPVTGRFDAFEWRVPDERFDAANGTRLIEELNADAARYERELIEARAAVTEAETVANEQTSASTAKAAQPQPGAGEPVAAAPETVEPTPPRHRDDGLAKRTATTTATTVEPELVGGGGVRPAPAPAAGRRAHPAQASDVYFTTHPPDDPGPLREGEQSLADLRKH